MKFSIKEDPYYYYFITSRLSSYRRIFNFKGYAEIVISSLDYLRKKKRCFLFAFVVMPTHIHFFIKPRKPYLCRDIVADFHSFTAHELLKDLKNKVSFNEGDLGEDAEMPQGEVNFAPLRGGAASSPRPAKLDGSENIWFNDILLDFKKAANKFSDRKYNIWESCVVKECYSNWFIRKVINYIHNNPNNKNWHLVDDRADYKYSSACFYDLGKEPIIELDNIRDLL